MVSRRWMVRGREMERTFGDSPMQETMGHGWLAGDEKWKESGMRNGQGPMTFQ